MTKNAPYHFSEEARRAYERLLLPIGIYQFVDNKVVTLLVSDGLCTLQGMSREALVNGFNNDMFAHVHPDDAERLAKLGLRYATQEGPYDIVYRTKLYGKDEYRYVHAVSKFHGMEDGSRIAITEYTDITASQETRQLLKEEFNTPVTQFLDESIGPMVIVTRDDHRILYYNKAMTLLLKPAVTYDSGLTFDAFFYGQDTPAIDGLFDEVDAGLRTIVEPVTKRKLDVNVLSCRWEETTAYALFFYEYVEQAENQEARLRHARSMFNNQMYSGNFNGLEYYQKGYRGMWLWNLSKDKLLSQSGHTELLAGVNGNHHFDVLFNKTMEFLDPKSCSEPLESVTRKALIRRFKEGTVPKSVDFTLHTPHGQVQIHGDVVMMESPVDGCIYLKLMEENATESMEMNDVIQMMVNQQYDFVAYMDVLADHIRLIDSKTENALQKDLSVSLKAYGQTLAQRIGISIQEPNDLIQALQEACGENDHGVLSYERADGRVKTIVIRRLNEEQTQFFIGCADVTALLKKEKEKEHELEKAKKQAEDADRRKDEFLAKMSHELRTPTGAILALSGFGMDDTLDPTLNQYFSKIHGSGEYMLSMINDMLDMAKLENGTITLQSDVMNAGDLCSRISGMVMPRAFEKNQSFAEEHSYPNSLYMVLDARRIQQVLINLLNNAIKYTPEGGHIAWKSNLVTKEDGSQVFVHQIIDDGVGMSESFQARMFEPYAQEHNSESANEMGTGLGLSIVKKVLEYMHGTIAVQSTLGKGTQFTVTIPYVPAKEAQIENYQKTNRPISLKDFDFHGKRVLICEDNYLNQQIEQKILENAGMNVTVADNGKIGVAQVKEHSFDLVIMDIRMPVMDGFEATREIRKFNTAVPILALSANAYKEDMQKSLDAGMQGHLVKPINTMELFTKIAELL